jgi:hypothetical protein
MELLTMKEQEEALRKIVQGLKPDVEHVSCKMVTFQWEGKPMTFFMDDLGYARDRDIHRDIPDEVVEAARMEAERNYY